jgi:hypothetical protein
MEGNTMNICRWNLIALLMLGLTWGCSGMRGQPFDPNLVGREFYLCCNTGFNPQFAASDANYAKYRSELGYSAGPMLAAGTRVRVTKVGSSGVAFHPLDSPTTYTITFSYGRKQLSPSQYFQNILREQNPVAAMQHVPRAIADAIHDGRLVTGMTKEQALIARGYPPAHRTPSLDANEWIYYDTPGFVDRVVFAGGKIQSVTRGPAPQ